MSKLNALMVEDQEDDVLLIVRELRRYGLELDHHRVASEQDLRAALAQDQWDFVILDHNLPGFGGLQALQILQEQDYDGPMITVSGTIGEETAVEVMRAGAHDYVMKDNLTRLGPAIERELREAEVRRERHRAREALRESEQRYRRLVETMGDGVTMIDLDHRITYVNEAFAEMVEYPPDELRDMQIEDLYAESSYPVLDKQLDRRFSDGISAEYEATLQSRCGDEIPVLTHASPLSDDEGEITGALAVIKDITARKEAEQALRASEARLSAILSAAPLGIGLIHDRVFEWVNQGMMDLLGYSRAELMGQDARMLYPSEEEYDRVGDVKYAQIEATGTGSILTRWTRKDGTVIDVDLRSSLVDPDDLSSGVIFTALDITERMEAEARIRESQERIRAIFDASPDGIVGIDLEGRITDSNASAARMLGLQSADELVGRRALEFIAEEQREYAHENMLRVLHEGAVRFAEYDLVRVDGERVPVEASANAIRGEEGDPIGVVSTIQDVSERREAQRELQELAQFRRSIIEQANIWLHVLDRGLNTVVWNPAAAEISGIPEEKAVGGKTAWGIMYPDPEERGEMLETARQIVEDGRVLENYETTIQTVDGDERAISWNARQLLDSDGEPIGLLAMGRDVTEHQELEEQLRQAVKMEAIGRLAGGIAHDFNNMLTAILGNVQLISMHMEDDEDQERLLGEIRTAARRSADLTRQLLAFSRKQALEPERIDLNAMIDRMEPILDRMIGEPIAVLTSLDPDLGTIEADPSQIDQVVMNLVVNARDAMPEGGTLTIETANVHLDESYAQLHADGEPGDYVMLSISDTGVGMDQETQEHIFEPFFTTKGEEEGTGLGLATVYGIVSQSGGHIHVYSEPGEGSVFKVYLPLMGADARPEAREEGADNILTGGETVLLVEDEDIVRDLIAGVLRRHGHEVVTAPDGQEALEVAEEHEGTIDIVVTDVVMPEMNGGQLAEALSETGYDIPVLFISGYTDNTIVQHGVLEGGVHYLQKPFDPEKLLRRIRSILDEEE